MLFKTDHKRLVLVVDEKEEFHLFPSESDESGFCVLKNASIKKLMCDKKLSVLSIADSFSITLMIGSACGASRKKSWVQHVTL